MASPASPGGVVAWHVDDLAGTFERLLSLGATTYEKPTVRGEGFATASVVDPFGDILGIMSNRHYVDVLKSLKDAGHGAARARRCRPVGVVAGR